MKDESIIQGFIEECREVYRDLHDSVEHIHETLQTPQGRFLVRHIGLSAVILMGDNEDIYEGEKKGGVRCVLGACENVDALVKIFIEQRMAGEISSVRLGEQR